MKNISVHAILTTASPLHITSPESFRYEIDPSTGYGRVKNGSTGGIACSGIQRRRFAPGAVEGIDFGLPVVAANNIAGGLRRFAAQIVLDVLRAKKQKIALSTYSAITCGAVTGIPDMRDLTYAEYTESAAHPYVGLFGGGPRLLRRRIQVLDALPVMDVLRAGNYTIPHPNGTGRNSNIQGLTQAACFKRGDDVSALLDVERMEDSVDQFQQAFIARQAQILEDKSAKDNDLEGSRYSTKTWSAFEFINPGVDFDFTINLKGVSDEQIGLFLMTLEKYANSCIGGQSRNGLGRIKLQDVVLVEKQITGETLVTDAVFDNNSLNMGNPMVAAYQAAWVEASKSITAAQLDELMKPPAEKEKAPKASKKTKAE